MPYYLVKIRDFLIQSVWAVLLVGDVSSSLHFHVPAWTTTLLVLVWIPMMAVTPLMLRSSAWRITSGPARRALIAERTGTQAMRRLLTLGCWG